MRSPRLEKGRSKFLLLVAVLLGLAIVSLPLTADATDGKGESGATGVAMPGPVPDTGLREPLSTSGGPIILRGTRPVSPAAAQAPNASNQAPPPAYTGFVPAPVYGSGWNTEYNYNGLNYAPGAAPE